MCVCICVCVYVCVYIYIYIHISISLSLSLYIYIYRTRNGATNLFSAPSSSAFTVPPLVLEASRFIKGGCSGNRV